MIISKSMYMYLKSYSLWIEEGAIDGESFYRVSGLCGNLVSFDCTYRTSVELMNELKNIFNEEGFDPTFPFGEDNFNTRFINQTQHEDPVRLKWINDHINEFENSLVKI